MWMLLYMFFISFNHYLWPFFFTNELKMANPTVQTKLVNRKCRFFTTKLASTTPNYWLYIRNEAQGFICIKNSFSRSINIHKALLFVFHQVGSHVLAFDRSFSRSVSGGSQGVSPMWPKVNWFLLVPPVLCMVPWFLPGLLRSSVPILSAPPDITISTGKHPVAPLLARIARVTSVPACPEISLSHCFLWEVSQSTALWTSLFKE